MARRSVLLPILFSGLTVLAGCGKKGPIQVPLARTPQTVRDFGVLQRGYRVFLTWTNPEATIDGSPIGEVAAVEIWMIKEERGAQETPKKWTAAEFENKAERLTQILADHFEEFPAGEGGAAKLRYLYLPEEKDFGRETLTFALRVRDGKRRTSQFSGPISLELLRPPRPPQKLQAAVFEDHIQIIWEKPEEAGEESAEPKGYNVYRSDAENLVARLNSALVKKLEYLDKNFTFGQTYSYLVRTVLESKPPLESEDSAPLEITPEDTFPPARPSGLTAIAGSGLIALSWEAGRESDLAGYRVWRRIADRGEFVPIASLTAAESSFQDAEVEKNKRYEYAITALDIAGNESPKSDPVRGIIRDSPPA
jgi:hypothetical protein